MKIRKIEYRVSDDMVFFYYDSAFWKCVYNNYTNYLHGDVIKEVIEYLQERNLQIKNLDYINLTE